MKKNILNKELNPLLDIMKKYKSAFWRIFWFSFVMDLLMLIIPIYSAQVIDRLAGSGNINTVRWSSRILYSVYLSYGLLLITRSFILNKIERRLDQATSLLILDPSVAAAATSTNMGVNQLLSDLAEVKTFVTSTEIRTLFNAPWTIIYILVIFLIHPYLGILTICGAIIIVSLASFKTAPTDKIVSAIKRVVSYRNVGISYFIKFIVIIVIPGLAMFIAAYVIITTNSREMTPGSLMMSPILVSRALVSFENSIKLWKSISGVLKSYKNINSIF